jgi:hypothetical protein
MIDPLNSEYSVAISDGRRRPVRRYVTCTFLTATPRDTHMVTHTCRHPRTGSRTSVWSRVGLGIQHWRSGIRRRMLLLHRAGTNIELSWTLSCFPFEYVDFISTARVSHRKPWQVLNEAVIKSEWNGYLFGGTVKGKWLSGHAERRGYLGETAAHQDGWNHSNHLIKRPCQVCRIGEVRGMGCVRNCVFRTDGDHGSSQLAPQHIATERKSNLLFKQMRETAWRKKDHFGGSAQRDTQVVGSLYPVQHRRHSRIEAARWWRSRTQRMHTMTNERAEFHAAEGLFDTRPQFRDG